MAGDRPSMCRTLTARLKRTPGVTLTASNWELDAPICPVLGGGVSQRGGHLGSNRWKGIISWSSDGSGEGSWGHHWDSFGYVVKSGESKQTDDDSV